MRSKISLMAPRSPSAALAASLPAMTCSSSVRRPSPSSTARRNSAFKASHIGLLGPPPSGGNLSSVMSSPVAYALARESIGRPCPAAQYRAQGKVLPRGAGHRGNKGDGTETVVNAKILFSVRDLWIARLSPATHPARGASGKHFGAGPEQNRRPRVDPLEREQMGPARGVPIKGSSRCADPPHHST
jgi:hypothetical protein